MPQSVRDLGTYNSLKQDTHLLSAGSKLRIKSDGTIGTRSEEHTSELQSRFDLVCRLLLENDPDTTYTYTLSLHDALPILYVVIPEVLTEHFIFGSLEFVSGVNAPICSGFRDLQQLETGHPPAECRIKTKDQKRRHDRD